MRRDDEGNAGPVGDVEHQINDGEARVRIQVAGRLIGQHEARRMHQGAGDGDALLLAAGKLWSTMLLALGQPHQGQRLMRPALALLACRLGETQRNLHVLAGRERREQMRRLEDEADLVAAQLGALALVEPGEVAPQESDMPFGRVIQPGEIAVLVGRSGSGKSTLLNLIAGIDRPTSGRVMVDGTDLTALDENTRTRFRRRRIGFVFQFFNLIPLLTVEENLLLPLDLNGMADAEGIARARGLLDRVGLGGRGASLPDRLSGGEQQRVAIARALVHEPALILADEPTGTLDAEMAAAVLALLDGLVREAGKTVVMVTHSREVVGVADRIFAIQRGRLVEQPAAPATSRPSDG